MPSGVGARVRAVRVAFGAAFAVASLFVLAAPARAQAAPGGSLTIVKQVDQGAVTAFFTVTGDPDVFNPSVSASAGAPGSTTLTDLPLISYIVHEDGTDGPFHLADITCTDPDADIDVQGQQAIITLTVEAPDVTCTFTNTLAGATILGQKIVTGDTSSWVRPAQFHITCPALQLDNDIEPPVGPGGPGTYIIGQGAIPPATCTISETDTGSDGPVSVTMVMSNHGVPIVISGSSLTFTSHVGDDLVLTVHNQFPEIARPEVPEIPGQGGTTTTVGGSTTTSATTTIATTTTTTATTTATTVPNGGASTSTPSGGSPTAAPTTAPTELPTTGSPTGGLIVGGLLALLAGLALVARTRRFVD
jgi:LPXTG-motif cell wall-anchored protein